MKIAEISKLNRPATNITLVVPGSKSYSLRALFIAALCDKPPLLTGLLESEDSKAMQNCLNDIKSGKNLLNAKESGITARFATALACISPGKQKITGASSLLKRPLGDLVDALRELGAKIEYEEKEGFLPIVVTSESLTGGEVTISGQTSSQYLSALLLIAPMLDASLEIEIEGEQISKPYIDITIDIMNHFGLEVENSNYQKYKIAPQKYQAKDYEVEGDYSSAAYFFAINALTGSNIKVENLNPNSRQGDKKLVEILQNSSGPGPQGPFLNFPDTHSGKPSLRATRGNFASESHINAEDFPDQAMTLAVLAAFKDGKTVIDGVKSLRIKETERVKAIEHELAKMGIKTESTDDRLIIYGGSPKPARIDTYGDHRVAMSFAVAATKLDGIKILNPEVVNKTFPGFWDELGKITEVKITDLQSNNLLLIGMRGSGKTTIGKILAEKLEMNFVDMDDFIEQKQGLPVRKIVKDSGWDFFRKLEAEACQELAGLNNTVIASGGGVILNDENMAQFSEDTLKLLFVADPELLSQRVQGDNNRHELTQQPTLLGELSEVWKNRHDKYYKNADFIFDTSAETPETVVKDIMDRLEL